MIQRLNPLSRANQLMAKTRQAIIANFDPDYTGKFLPQTM
jgi:hypothetical protein